MSNLALVHVPQNSSLGIAGDGELTARSTIFGAGIGGGGKTAAPETPKIVIGSSESTLTIDTNASMPAVYAKMDKSVYPEPVKLKVRTIDSTTVDGRS